MKAIVYEQNGGPEVLKMAELPKPTAGDGEVLIKVAGTSYNPVDAAIRSGFFPMPVALPTIPGSEASGTIEALGAGVTAFSVGDKVIVELLPAQGGAAEYVVAPASNVVAAPKTVDLVEAAGIPLVTQTAYQGLFVHAKVQKSQRVLLVGAGGAVGGVAVQLAHRAGAYVIATASGADVDRVKGLGADEVVDYKKSSISNAITEPVDAAVVLRRLTWLLTIRSLKMAVFLFPQLRLQTTRLILSRLSVYLGRTIRSFLRRLLKWWTKEKYVCQSQLAEH